MTIAATVLSSLLMLTGFLGIFLRVLPDIPLVLGGYLLYGILAGWQQVGGWPLYVELGVAVLAMSIDFLAGALGARHSTVTDPVLRRRISRWSSLGAAVGGLAGALVFPPWGLFVGTALGTFIAALVVRARLDEAAQAGLWAVVGLIMGMASKVLLAIVMIGLFVWRIV
ncbi:MAG: DUF456 domain-containing protein [Firmicutes bacterium]|nr:DUF456 domain-containing protein [Bacillota bacterium]